MKNTSTSQQPQNLLENLRKVITLVDQLRDIGLHNYIKLPRIAVLGIQSSGKSSLLEQIVGLDFLPRGEGVCTRRPLELRLTYVPKHSCPHPYAVFEEIKNKKFSDFGEVKQNIVKLTEKVAGTNKNIVDDPIILQVFGPDCPDLTLVDLPGITRIPLANSGQPDNIEQITTEMARKYCADPSTIILCVVAANQDLSTSDALKMALQLDPQGMRTFGVLTKIDIMDRGTNALKMLKGQDVHLKYGYVGVKLRSQQDIRENVSVQKAIQQEREFFASHPIYSSVPGEVFGTKVLTGKLTKILYRHIRSFLPELMKEMNSRIGQIQERLDKLGPGLPTEDKEKLHYIWQIINSFTIRYKNSISGSYEKNQLSTKALVPAGAKIREIFSALYQEQMDGKYKTLQQSDAEIQQIIYRFEGDNIPGFLSIDAFFALLNPELKKLQEPAKDCIDETYQILEEYANIILQEQLEKLPEIRELINDQVLAVIHAAKREAQEAVDELLEAELNYIFTNDYEFLLGRPLNQDSQKPEVIKGNPLVHELKKKIAHYFKIVVRTLRDNIPKVVGHFLVKGSQNHMLLTLQENLMQNQDYLNIVNEPLSIVEERKTLKNEIETLKSAQKIVKRDPDLSEYILKLGQANDDDDLAEQQVSEEQQVKQAQSSEKKPAKEKIKIFEDDKDLKKPQPQFQTQPQPQQNPNVCKPSSSYSIQQKGLIRQDQLQPKPDQQKSLFPEKSRSPTQQQQYYQQPSGQGQGQKANDPLNPQPAVNPLSKPQGQSFTQKATNQYNSAVDKGVDSAMQDQRVQDGLKQGARQGANAAVKNALGSNAPAFVTNAAESAAEKAIQSKAAQDAIKDAAKDQLRAPDDDKKPKSGLFGFIKK